MRNIFVFGSNLAGIHGAGSAKHAFQYYGAIWGRGVGLHGDSYAIPTKDAQLKTLPINKVSQYIIEFIDFANKHPEMNFNIVEIGCGLAGFEPKEIAPMFTYAPNNCQLPFSFLEIIHK